jgi:hypothetical protein
VNIYLLDDPAKPAEYARLSCVGTWTEDRICSVCGEPTARLIEPLQIEWDEGTDRIGDFSWGGYHCVVLDNVRACLESKAFEVGFGDVQVMQPTERAKRQRVPFPYHGPRLSWLIPTARLKIDDERSGVRVISDCSACGQRRYSFRRDGLVLPKSAWKGERIFLIDQFGRSRATFVTEEALSTLVRMGFSNLCPRHAGSIES